MKNGKCKVHGGLASHGLASPAIDLSTTQAKRKGRYSTALPRNLRDKYERALTDSNLLSLRDDVALLEARIHELASRLRSGEGLHLWRDLVSYADEWTRLADEGNQVAADAQVRSMVRVIRAGADAEQTWEGLYNVLRLKKDVSSEEHKRERELNQTITAEQALALIMALAASVNNHCTDRVVRRAILSDLQRAIDGRLAVQQTVAQSVGAAPLPGDVIDHKPAPGV